MHCVEGGFHLGPTPEAVDQGVTRLASRGVAYLILAHLFFRRIATDAPAIPQLTGSHRHIGLGSDFDGFIKPTLGGLETEADTAKLELALRKRYGDEATEAICSGNALRLLRTYWVGAQSQPG